tara:strand:+ start:466 stop:1233 length:768 start_codon:yes stop_codon:yes gene_type:complete
MKFLEELDLEEGKTLTTDCPVCKGKKKFTATRVDDVILYNCFRNSCTVRGVKKVARTVESIRKKMNGQSVVKKVVEFEVPEYFSNDLTECDEFIMRWNLFSIRLFHDVKNDRVVFPMMLKGKIIDAIGRSLNPDSFPKWYKYGNSMSYYAYRGDGVDRNVAVVVEDVISAIAVGSYFPVIGFSLLGTALQQEHLYVLSNFDRVVVALDPDASKKSLEHAKELSNYVSDVKVLKLTDDLKYKNLEDFKKLEEILNG